MAPTKASKAASKAKPSVTHSAEYVDVEEIKELIALFKNVGVASEELNAKELAADVTGDVAAREQWSQDIQPYIEMIEKKLSALHARQDDIARNRDFLLPSIFPELVELGKAVHKGGSSEEMKHLSSKLDDLIKSTGIANNPDFKGWNWKEEYIDGPGSSI